METDLSRLNSASFERLVRALLFRQTGPGGTVYSSGPDGGRDFTYEGLIPGYENKKWNGYLVVQAKFREHSGRADDVQWLVEQIQREFLKYAAGEIERAPDYYIIATNVHLSGSDGKGQGAKRRTGGYSKVSECLKQWKTNLAVKDFDIWPADKIIDLVANAPEIRQAYAAWITPGDVLSKALQRFDNLRTEFKPLISRALKVALHRDQFVRLKDAGSVGDIQIRTSQVFVDLPLPTLPPNPEATPEGQALPFAAVAQFVDRAKEKLDPESLTQDEARGRRRVPTQKRNRIVLVGGPGQGKSTATLFLTQLFRAALLRNDPATKRDDTLKRLVPEILSRAMGEGVSASVPHRYPIHISLPRFADAISQSRTDGEKPPSLLSQVAVEVAQTCDSDEIIQRSDIRDWLRLYPWVLVLDGLDEVPPTGERPAVLEAISEFFLEVSEANADVLVIVTTRPQGYNKDLDPNLWEHWRLAELNPSQALRYAKAFGEARYPLDRPRREDVHSQLERASKQPATARLMTSPLQVTILHFIVDTGGGVPTARWTLFHEYFEVLRKRERAKGGETQKILEKHWSQLGPIHHRAGLILQSDSERAGNAGAKFTHDRFRRLLTNYLRSEGFESPELETRVEELMALALHRLVLLSTQEEGSISFDVRSLQEFMAAAALTSGDVGLMEERLSYIAGMIHWRHVFLIAASRCFADDAFHYRRAAILAIPRQLDALDPDLVVKNGAKLALELLADGIGSDHPHSRRPLLLHAMDLLVLGPNNLDERLVMVWDSGTIDLAKTILEERVHEGDTPAAKAAWRLILKLAATEEWAEDFACSRWPENAERAFDIFAQAQAPLPSAQLLQKAINAFIHVGPARRSELGGFFALSHAMDGRKIAIAHSELEKLARPTSQLKDRRGEFKIPSATGPLSVQIITLDTVAAYEVFEQARGGNESWSAFTSSLDFLRHPDPDSLASALQSVAARSFQLAQGFAAELPWPVGSLIDEADGPDQLNAIAAEVKAGERGTLRDWQAAERRWRHQGVVLEDFEYARSGKRFGSDIARVGLPLARISSISQASEMLDVFKRMTKLSGEIPNHNIRNQVLETAGLALFGLEPDSIREPLLAEHALAAMAVRRVINLDLLEQIEATVLEDPNVLRGLSEVANRCGLYVTSDLSPSRFIRCFNENKLNRGLLHVITTVLFGRKVSRPFLQALRTLSPEGFTPEETDTLNVKASVATLRFAMGITATLPEDMDIIIRHATPWLFEQVQELLTSDEVALSERISVCVCLIQTLRSAADTRERLVYDPLRRALDARRSNIHDRHIWCDTLRLSYDSHDCLSPPQRAAA